MKRFLIILAALCLFIVGVYYLQNAVDYRTTSTKTDETTISSEKQEVATLTMITSVVSKTAILSQNKEDFKQNEVYRGEFSFQDIDPKKKYEFQLTLVNAKGNVLVNAQGQKLECTQQIKINEKEGKIFFQLMGNQTLQEQLQELESFQAKGVLREIPT